MGKACRSLKREDLKALPFKLSILTTAKASISTVVLLASWRSSRFHSLLQFPQTYLIPLPIWMVRLWSLNWITVEHSVVKTTHLCDLILSILLLLRCFNSSK